MTSELGLSVSQDYLHPTTRKSCRIELSQDLFGIWQVNQFHGSHRRIDSLCNYDSALSYFKSIHESLVKRCYESYG